MARKKEQIILKSFSYWGAGADGSKTLLNHCTACGLPA